jgi:hypothetical protein
VRLLIYCTLSAAEPQRERARLLELGSEELASGLTPCSPSLRHSDSFAVWTCGSWHRYHGVLLKLGDRPRDLRTGIRMALRRPASAHKRVRERLARSQHNLVSSYNIINTEGRNPNMWRTSAHSRRISADSIGI